MLKAVWRIILCFYMALGFDVAVRLASHGDRAIPGPFGKDKTIVMGVYGLLGLFFVLGLLPPKGEKSFVGMDCLLWTLAVAVAILAGAAIGLVLALT